MQAPAVCRVAAYGAAQMPADIHSLEGLFVHELEGAYRMENRLVEILDEMAANATNDRIATGFEDHREQTKTHVERLRTVFESMDRDVTGRECALVEALDAERLTVEERVRDPDLLNMFYLGAGMKTERIEITTYESILQQADRLDLSDAAVDALRQNLGDEEDALDQLQTLVGASELKSLWQRLKP